MRQRSTYITIVAALVCALFVACNGDHPVPDAASDAVDIASDAEDGVSPDELNADVGADAPWIECDVAAQNCPGEKCTIVDPAGTGDAVNACVPITGTRQIGDTCTRTGGGADDCAPGGFCTNVPGGAGSTLHCRKLCNVDSDCASITGTVCGGYVWHEGMRGGFCVPTCTLWGTDCDPNTHCVPAPDPDRTRMQPICRGDVTPLQTAGGPCLANTQCQAGLMCTVAWTSDSLSPGTCAVLCDAAHPCSTGSCTPLSPPGPAGVGTCP